MTSFEVAIVGVAIAQVIVTGMILRELARLSGETGSMAKGFQAVDDRAKKHSDAIRELKEQNAVILSVGRQQRLRNDGGD